MSSTHNISNAPSTAAAVANEFLRLGKEEPYFPPIDQMKLQKLLFYAHAWHLAINDKPLFDEDFEAWPWGPVTRNVYYQTREYRESPVSGFIQEIQSNPNTSGFRFVEPKKVEESVKCFIKSIWDVHKQYTGIQLSNSTHASGEPWTIMKEMYKKLEDRPIIPNQLIADIFKRKLENANPSSANTST